MAARRIKRSYRIVGGSKPAAKRQRPPSVAAVAGPSDEELALELFKRPRQVLIADAAYHRSQRRPEGTGDPVQDWLEAEAEIDGLLADARKRMATRPQVEDRSAGSTEPSQR